MFFRNCVFLCVLSVCLGGTLSAQSVLDATFVPLTVDEGVPLQVTLTEKLHFKENEPVHAKVVEPIYAFDREVIPVGAEVVGRITGFQNAGKLKRVFTMVRGDFTPVRQPQITFDTLILPDGRQIPIETVVVPGTQKLVRYDGDNKSSGKDLKNALMSTVQQPGKDGFSSLLWGLAPYHPQTLPSTTRFNVVLRTPLDFGAAVFGKGALDELGSQPTAGTLASVRLVTPLDSRSSAPGAVIEAVLTEPLFSGNNRLIFPAGSRVHGEVEQVIAARKLHHHGRLAFRFTSIELPASMALGTMLDQPLQQFEGNLVAVQAPSSIKNLHINPEGVARIQESKKRFISPAISFVNAGRSFDASADSFGQALSGAYLGKFLGGFIGRDSSLGLPANISGAMVPPLGIGLHLFSAARAVYSNFLARGQDIRFPANTPMQIRLDKPLPE
jgi:hypothetical protein